jgi:hypothetical protein
MSAYETARHREQVERLSDRIKDLQDEVLNLESEKAMLREVLASVLSDVGYACDANECECGNFDENGSCCHTLGRTALALISE